MKTSTTLTTFSTLLALASAAPNPVQKRDTCTIFGFTYWCPDGSGSGSGSGSTTTAAPAPVDPTPTPADPTASAPAPAPTGGNGGGESTGGASEYTSGSTADDITSDTGCTPLTVIFARGTSEGGNIGSVIGAPMFQALLSDVGAESLTLQGVDYPANSAGNANCGAAGGGDMADKVSEIQGRCPDTQIVLSGYSQGACVVHNAVGSQGASGIAGAVVFGDPFNGQDFDGIDSGNVLNVCRSDDGICNRGPSSGSGGHISYGSSAGEAATFIEGLAGL